MHDASAAARQGSDLVEQLLSFCNPEDVGRCACVSREWARAAAAPAIWAALRDGLWANLAHVHLGRHIAELADIRPTDPRGAFRRCLQDVARRQLTFMNVHDITVMTSLRERSVMTSLRKRLRNGGCPDTWRRED